MCQKRNSTRITVAGYRGEIRIDECISFMIDYLWHEGIATRASCCGHGIYPLTVVVWIETKGYFELITGKQIPRSRKFYKKDKKGYYYIPEVSKPKN